MLVETGAAFRVRADDDGLGAVTRLAMRALLSPAITRRLIEAYVHAPPARAGGAPARPGRGPHTAGAGDAAAGGAWLSNAEIAAEAFVSEPTVKTHVARILMKLGLRERLQIAVFAHRHHLV